MILYSTTFNQTQRIFLSTLLVISAQYSHPADPPIWKHPDPDVCDPVHTGQLFHGEVVLLVGRQLAGRKENLPLVFTVLTEQDILCHFIIDRLGDIGSLYDNTVWIVTL